MAVNKHVSNSRPKSASFASSTYNSKSNVNIPICRHFGDGSANFRNNIKTLKEDLLTKFLGNNFSYDNIVK